MLAAALVVCTAAPGQEKKKDLLVPDIEPGITEMSVRADVTHFLTEEDTRIILLLGNVHARFGVTEIWADNVVLWCDRSETDPKVLLGDNDDYLFDVAVPSRTAGSVDPGDRKRGAAPSKTDRPSASPPPSPDATREEDPLAEELTAVLKGAFLEIYAEGDIRMINGGETSIRASQIYFHLEEKRGLIVEGDIHSTTLIRDKPNPLVIRADEIRQVCSDYATAKGVQVSTCTFGRPHFHLKADDIVLKEGVSTGRLSIRDSAAVMGVVPIPLPDMSFSLGDDWILPLRSLKVGKSSRFGVYMKSRFGNDINEFGNKVNRSLGLEGRPFRGSWFLDFDIYGRRGVGMGPGIKYRSPGLYDGFLKSYYICDKKDEDRRGGAIENEDRTWIQSRNRLFMPDDWLLDLELSYISERNMLFEYFEEEAKTDKDQETLAYLHRAKDSQSLSLLGKFRINDFDDDTERLPEARWYVSDVPLLDPTTSSLADGGFAFHNLYFRQSMTTSHVRYRPSDQPGTIPATESERFFRQDYLGGLEAPMNWGPLRVVPFVEQRVSFFERELDTADPCWRSVSGTGIRTGMLFHRSSEAECDFLNIHGLRHVLEPSVTFRNNFLGGPRPGELIQIDEIEQATDTQTVAFNLRHRMQTRDSDAGAGAKTFFEAFYSILAYTDRGQSPTTKRFSEMDFDIYWMPDLDVAFLKNMKINEEGKFDPYERDLNEINSLLILEPYDRFRLRMAHRWIRENHSYMLYGLTWVMTPRWEAAFDIRRDFRTNEWMKESLRLRRRVHQWAFEFEFEIDRSSREHKVSFSIYPLALFGDDEIGDFYDPLYAN